MKDRLAQSVNNFLYERSPIGAPLLMGFSGGPDSLALFHLLRQARRVTPFELHVAHVDHNWREESSQQASFLKNYVEGFEIFFHLKKLEGISGENAAREGRLAFFSSLYAKLGCRALVLGHQRDDQSETVLKRILEGAGLEALGGILRDSRLQEMDIWRPLLSHDKKEIYAWLKAKKLIPLEDPTNKDPKFLRSRMRTEILPWLSRQFGKQVGKNLCKIGLFAQELKSYLDQKMAPYEKLIDRQRGELRIDFNRLGCFEALEIKAFLRKVIDEENLFLSYEAFETFYRLIESGAPKKTIPAGKKIIEIHRRVVAIKKMAGY